MASLTTMAAFLEFQQITKRFGPVTAVDDVSLAIERDEVFALLGPSGCGKTTLLRLLAGFERPDAGRIRLDGVDITDLPPHRRPVNTVFQNYALFPHLSVWENVAFGLRVAQRPAAEITAAVERMLALVQLQDQAAKRPAELSGGQKQRVAIARALVLTPRVLLLDEPLAALDLKLRQRMLLELERIHNEVGITFLFVTHDQGEAMGLSDRLAVMAHGRIEQIGTPAEVYEAPRTSFVAAFIGDTNILAGEVVALPEADYCMMRLAGLPELQCFNDARLPLGQAVSLSLRPEKLRLARERPTPDPRHNVARGRITDLVYLGAHTRFRVEVGPTLLQVSQPHNRFFLDEQPLRRGDDVWVWWHADDGFMLPHAPGAAPHAEG